MKLYVSILVIFLFVSATTSILNAEPNTTLSPEDVLEPDGRSQRTPSYGRSITVNVVIPYDEPALEWVISPDNLNTDSLRVDNNGNTWLTCYINSEKPSSLKCYNEQGILIFEKQYPVSHTCKISTICHGAVIVDVADYPSDEKYLECFDLVGNLIWQTEGYESDFSIPSAQRISDNRIMLKTGEESAGTFKIISLLDGNLSSDLTFPEYYGNEDFVEYPIELKNGGWITFQDDRIVAYKPDLNISWSHDVEIVNKRKDKSFHYPLLVNDKALLINTKEELISFDPYSGVINWVKGEFFDLRGFTADDSVITCAYVPKELTMEIMLDPNKMVHLVRLGLDGEVNMELPALCSYIRSNGMNVVVSADGNILCGGRNGLFYIDPEGLIIWKKTNSELNIPVDIYHVSWNLNPTANQRIVIGMNYFPSEENNDRILSFKAID